MPTSSIDFALSVSAIIIILVGAISGINFLVEPELTLSNDYDSDRYYHLGRYLLLSEGEPIDWGLNNNPTTLGFASGTGYYELDIDKITCLNSLNVHSVNYSTLWKAFGMEDLVFRIKIELLFNISINLTGSLLKENYTTYFFSVNTVKDKHPISAQIRYYAIVRNYIFSGFESINNSGLGSIQVNLPNSVNGDALLICIGKISDSVVSYEVLSFAHNSAQQEPRNTYAVMSPLNYILDVELSKTAVIIMATAFSFEYILNLSEFNGNYLIPRILDQSPIILVLTGVESSNFWIEWVAYPQIPLKIGSEMHCDYVLSDVESNSYLVDIKGAFYIFNIEFRRVNNYG